MDVDRCECAGLGHSILWQPDLALGEPGPLWKKGASPVTTPQFQEALGLTVVGLGTAFLVLILLMAVVLGMKRVFAMRFVQGRAGAIADAEAADARRGKALAGAVAVSVALAAEEGTSLQDAQEDTQA